jgi:peptidyl-dipeptidase Dcp
VISTDAYEAFTEGDGPYDKEVAKRLYESVFSVKYYRSRRCLQRFRDVTPRVMLS